MTINWHSAPLQHTASFFVPAKVVGSSYINHFLQPDTLIPDPSNPQAWNRYSYVKNNPINFNDPSGHSADCGIGDSYCRAGKLDVSKRANDLYKNLPNRKGRNWISLSDTEKSILSEGGWDEGAFNDKGGVSKADALYDPATYVVGAFTGGGLLRAGYKALVSYATINAGASMTSIGSVGMYEKAGTTYFHLPNPVYNALSKIGIGQNNVATLINRGVINTQIAAGKPTTVTLYDPGKTGSGTQMEMDMYFAAQYVESTANWLNVDKILQPSTWQWVK